LLWPPAITKDEATKAAAPKILEIDIECLLN